MLIISLFMLLFFISCAHHTEISDTPSWVEGIRSGEERMRIVTGGTTLYRRIAETCEKATTLAKEDIEREYHRIVKHSVEVVFYDRKHGDCAVTLSVGGKAPASEPEKEDVDGFITVRNIQRDRAENAARWAFNGYPYNAFSQLTKDTSRIIFMRDSNICYKGFKTSYESIHGTTRVCWRHNVIVGYCSTTTNTCDSKDP